LSLPLSLLAGLVLTVIWIVYAILVSISPIAPLQTRQRLAGAARALLLVYVSIFLIELHPAYLRVVFESNKFISTAGMRGQFSLPVLDEMLSHLRTIVAFVGPPLLLVLPFIQRIALAAEGGKARSWTDLLERTLSRIVLFLLAAIVPLALWLAMMQLA